MTQISGKMHLLTVHISGLYCTRFLSDQMRYTLSFIQSCQNLHKKFQTWLIFGKNSLNFFFKRFSFFVNWFVPCSSSPFLCENKWQLNCHRKFAIFHSFVLDFISFTEFLILMCKKRQPYVFFCFRMYWTFRKMGTATHLYSRTWSYSRSAQLPSFLSLLGFPVSLQILVD